MGVYGEISHILLDPTEITSCKFQLKIAKDIKVIAKKRLTNYYEIHCTFLPFVG